MNPIYQTCEPRDEVLSGDLREDIFAARLHDVIVRQADPVYQEPDVFFDNTYPTDGLKLLLDEALGRLTGTSPANNAIIRLETAFGGGKTHNLIALHHAANGYAPPFVDPAIIPAPGAVRIAGVVGSDLDPTNGMDHGDATTYTLWGEIAYQLGGYHHMRNSDLQRTAPGTGVLDRIIGDAPTLIMIDEIARHLRVAKTVPTETGRSDLAKQTVAFLMSLLEFAASKEQVVVVFTLAAESDAFSQETEELQEAKRISARQERVITPTAETEIAAIVTHRLFQYIDRAAAEETAAHYASYYHRCVEQGADLPQRALRAEYAQEIVDDYPFHPELLNTLNRKTSTIPNFQKTRGALRLLAMVIRELWADRPEYLFLIHPHDICLGNDEIANDLTSRLERPRFKQVIKADIVSQLEGTRAHAQVLDEWTGTGITRRVATAAFLHSIVQGGASGVDPADLTLAVIVPDEDPALALKAANDLVENGWFFEYDGRHYRFKTEPSINKIINDEMGVVSVVPSKLELDRRIRQVWKKGYLQPVFFPSEPADVDDDAFLPKLVIIHYDADHASIESDAIPDLVARIFERAGSQEGFRRFKNNLVFLVADKQQVGPMVDQMRRYMAIQRILTDSDRLTDFLEEQRSRLKKAGEAAELDVRVAITRTYKWFYYPTSEAPQSQYNLGRVQLPAQEQGEVMKDQSGVILRLLQDLNKVQTQDAKPLAPQYVKQRAWDASQEKLTTEDLRKAFARKMGLRMMLDVNQLKKTIKFGIENGVWIYYDTRAQMGYGKQSPPPAVEISDDAYLYTLEAYEQLGWPVKGVTDVVMPTPGTQAGFDDDLVLPPLQPIASKARLQGEGAPGQAFQGLRDACDDYKIARVQSITVSFDSHGPQEAQEVRAFGLAISQLGKGDYWIDQRLTAEFPGEESVQIYYRGEWDRYRRLKQVTDTFGPEAEDFVAQTTLRIGVEEGLDVHGEQFKRIVEVFSQLGMGHLTVSAEPLEEGATA